MLRAKAVPTYNRMLRAKLRSAPPPTLRNRTMLVPFTWERSSPHERIWRVMSTKFPDETKLKVQLLNESEPVHDPLSMPLTVETPAMDHPIESAVTSTTHVNPWTNLVYIHPLSQLILLYFQTSCHDWIARHGLDNLTLHRDGTFTLEAANECSMRIWTLYEASERRHLLLASKHHVRYEYVLQDNRLTAWQGFKRRSLPERIQDTMHELMTAMDQTADP